MNEEIEYAEMLEIPVSTVNVIKKKKRGGIRPKADLKETLIKEVNERVEKNVGLPAQAAAPARLYRVENPSIATEKREENAEEVKGVASEKATDSTAEKAQKEKTAKTEKTDGANKAALDKAAPDQAEKTAADPTSAPEENKEKGQRIDTVPIFGEKGEFYKNAANFNGENYLFKNEGDEEIWGRYLTNEKTAQKTAAKNGEKIPPVSRRVGALLTAEFAISCALCGLIFLTNVMMPESGINTFFKNLNKEQAAVDNRTYADFELSGVVSELSDAQLTVSPSGVLTFTDACCVYPAVDGKVASVEKNADGTFEVKIAHNANFYGVISGLDYVYYDVGQQVYSNIPVGYTGGNTAVSVTMYADGEILTAYTVDEENTLVWAEE